MMARCFATAALAAVGLAATFAQAGEADGAPPRSECAAPVQGQSEAASAAQEAIDQVSRTWFRMEWKAYAAKFISPEGRVIDNANGGVSHSEGQGYGLLLANAANDGAAFQRIWNWTKTHLQVRQDRLLAWRWEPKTGVVSDHNNASDGDILVAWALARGARTFGRPDYLTEARAIARALGAKALAEANAGLILLPGVSGFSSADQPDGPIVNLSYWVFPALPALCDLAPEYDWTKLTRTGLKLLDRSRFGVRAAPVDWLSVHESAAEPAKNFPPHFSYDAVRIPLYLAWSDDPAAMKALRRLSGLWRDGAPGALAVIDVKTGASGAVLDGVGYRMIMALARCAATGQAVDPDLVKARDALYYPDTLRMLSLSVLQERYLQCL